jgi:hypothetical protein
MFWNGGILSRNYQNHQLKRDPLRRENDGILEYWENGRIESMIA